MKDNSTHEALIKEMPLSESISMYRELVARPGLATIAYITEDMLVSLEENEEEKQWFNNLNMTINAAPLAENRNRDIPVVGLDNKGVDFLDTVLRNMSASGEGIYLISGSEEHLENLRNYLVAVNDRINIIKSTVYNEAELDGLYNEINVMSPGIIVSCMPWQIQGQLMMQAKQYLSVPVWLGIAPKMVVGGNDNKGNNKLVTIINSLLGKK